ncbi:hypothetical protein BGZ83_001567 [Gryganskiella cystojenkinii]|nr:hypothetical protein BGZ83_001567 [Gryganskiella cystojenkinii]
MDPPPILKLIVRNQDGTLADISQMDLNFCMVMADIYSANRSTPCTLVTSSARTPTFSGSTPIWAEGTSMSVTSMSVLSLSPPNNMVSRNLLGSTVAAGNMLFNLENEQGVYFVFQDISVRSEGTFTLKFSLFLRPELDELPSMITATAFSEPFTIYSGKRFPGMTGSTPLSRCFAKQGIKIPIRKEPRTSGKDEYESNSVVIKGKGATMATTTDCDLNLQSA